jgi:tRNA A-37 threonylcarbamoyl transferase component Bud32
MDEDSDLLDRLAGSVADGDSIDWEQFAQLPPDDPRRRLLEHLRIIAEIAEHHRSAVDDPVAVASTGPAFDGYAHVGHVRMADPGGPEGGIGQWGHLVLRRKIGQGAFGEVFHAHDTWLDHPVALKLLKPEIARADFSSRILHEARRLARVRHPNVVSVHGADMHDGRVGFWMDLIEGNTLADVLAAGRFSAGEATHIGQEVCLALAAVHRANLVHRDVKAQNVMRAADGGRIVLMDFGAGEFIGGTTTPGRVRGTPLYLAPEILTGHAASVSTDVYALGVLLYHLVTGQFPVNGTSLDSLLDAHMKGERRRLRDARPELPASFVRIVERAIDPDPARRFASAGEFYEALGGEKEKASDTWLKKLARAGRLVVGILVAAYLFGYITFRLFESMLRIDPMFGASAADHLTWGLRSLAPFAFVWTFYAVVLAALVGLRALIWRRVGPIGQRLSQLTEGVDPLVQAGWIVCVGAVGLAVFLWWSWNVFNGLTALALDRRPETLDLSVLSLEGRAVHRNQVYASTVLSFVMGLAIWFWFPRLEKRASEPGRVRALKWAAVTVAFLAILLEMITRPAIWDLREVVLLQRQPLFVIGTSEEELLLYDPAPGARRSMRVRADTPGLRRNFARVALFQPVPEVK